MLKGSGSPEGSGSWEKINRWVMVITSAVGEQTDDESKASTQ